MRVLSVLALLLFTDTYQSSPQHHRPHLKHDLDTTEIIAQAGYSPETHQITTPDGYMLKIHRIPGEGPVVFCQHGLEDSSATWVLPGPDHGGIAFRLAEQGYDVWLGNYRGNSYSRGHVSLNADTDNEYWQFTWDEMAKYDLPTELDYVLEKTGKEKIYYIGHSMGTTTYMVMNSMDQSWGDKVEVAVLLAPIAYVEHMASPLKYLTPFLGMIDWLVDHLGIGEFLPSNWFMDFIASFACGDNKPLEFVCENIVFLLCGYDQAQMNATMMSTVASHIPAGTSSYTVIHYAQEIKSGNFQGMDWGDDERNLQHHGSTTPPQYELGDVNTKIALFWGDNDWLAQPKDLLKIFTGLPNIVENYQIPWEGWNHFDFLFAIDIDVYQNPHLIEVLQSYPID